MTPQFEGQLEGQFEGQPAGQLTGQPIVRPAVPADAAALTALEAVLFGPDAWSSATVGRSLAGDLVLVTSDRLGYAVVSVAGDVADLQRIGVDPGHRRGGLAHALLAEAMSAARTAGAARMLLEVSADNTDALAFYAAEGFAGIDRRRRYYRGGADAIVLERPLAQGR